MGRYAKGSKTVKQIALYLPPEMAIRLRYIATIEKTNVSQIVRKALEETVFKEEKYQGVFAELKKIIE